MNLVAFVLAVGLIELVLPYFNQLVSRTVTFSVWLTGYWWLLLLFVLVGGIFLSGYYPALALLNRKPITLLKESSSTVSREKALAKCSWLFSIQLP